MVKIEWFAAIVGHNFSKQPFPVDFCKMHFSSRISQNSYLQPVSFEMAISSVKNS